MQEHDRSDVAQKRFAVGAGQVSVARTTSRATPVRLGTGRGSYELTRDQAMYLRDRLTESLEAW